MTGILLALLVLCQLVLTITSHPAQPLYSLSPESTITRFGGWLNETTSNLKMLESNSSQTSASPPINEGLVVETSSKPTTIQPNSTDQETMVISRPTTTTPPIELTSTAMSMISEESMISKVDADILAKVLPKIILPPEEYLEEELKPELRSSGNSVKIKVTELRRGKGLAAKVIERIRKNKAGKLYNDLSNMAARRKLNAVQIYAGDDSKKKNIIVVANGGTSESESLKPHLLQPYVPIFGPMRDISPFDGKFEAKSYSMYSQAVPVMPPPVGPPHPHRPHLQHPSDRWHEDSVAVPPPLPPPPPPPGVDRVRRTRHLLDGSLMHPMTETANAHDADSDHLGSSIAGYNDASLIELLRGALLSAASINNRDRAPSSASTDYTSTLESLASKLGLKGFSLLTDSNVGGSLRSVLEPTRFTDWNQNGMIGSSNGEDKLLQLLLEQQSPRSNINYLNERLTLGERMNIFGASEFEPSPLTKISQALLGEETLEDTLKKLALFELLNKKQVPLTAQIFEELKHQIHSQGLANQKLLRHTQQNTETKSARTRKKSEDEDDDEISESSGKSSENTYESRTRKLRKTIRDNLSKLREQREKIRGRLRGSSKEKNEDEYDEYEEAGTEDSGQESRVNVAREKPSENSTKKTRKSRVQPKDETTGKPPCQRLCKERGGKKEAVE